ncbi:hypothetical protein QZH41_006085 [Actinostola sp. cb2023]|nr:hypothetical protein QZH41_006085 [Actinostola sp. cb2023]
MARILLLLLLVAATFALFSTVDPRILDDKLEKEISDEIDNQDASKPEEKAGLFEGDIEMEESMQRALTAGKLMSRDAVISPLYHWPNGKVYYAFNKSVICQESLPDLLSFVKRVCLTFCLSVCQETDRYTEYQILRAFKHIEFHTCVRFQRYRNESNTHYVMFIKGNGCYSRIGRSPSKWEQHISIGRGCERLGTIVHESMHALGFFHEHTRPDRDKFVTIKWKNIIKRHMHNFKKYPRYLGTSLGKPYDYLSLMHYSKFAFAKNGYPTIVPTPKHLHAKMGQRFGLSYYDAYQINKLYKCKAPYADEPYQPCADVKQKGNCFNPIPYKPIVWAKVCEKTCCVLDAPPKWSAWSAWSPCSKSCHYGVKSRTRNCIGDGFGQTCDGPALETAKCNENVPCEGLVGWNKTSVEVDECAGTVTVTIIRSRVTNCEAPIKINTQDGTATQPGDYDQINGLVITFLKGETTKTVTFKVNADTSVEGPESFTATITADPSKLEVNQPKCIVNIKDRSAKIGFKPDKYTVSENDKSVKVIVHRYGNKDGKNTCSISSQDANSAASPADYQGIKDVPVVFEAGDESKVIEINIVDDSAEEPDEIFKLSLTCEKSPCTDVTPFEAIVVIKSDDVLRTWSQSPARLVDGKWSPWGPYGDCDKKCGGGSQSRSRTCTNPAPQGEGKQCAGDAQSTQACNTHYCPTIVHMETVVSRVAPVSNTRPDSAATPNHNMEAKNVSDQQEQVKHVTLIHVQLMEPMVAILHMETVVSRVAPVSNTRPDSAATPNHNMEAKNVSDQQEQAKRVALIHVQLMESMVAILHMETVVSRVAPVSNTRPDSAATPNHNMEAKTVSDQQKQVKHVTLIHVQTQDGSAVQDDYVPLDLSFTFLKGETSKSVTFTAKSDNVIEAAESFTATITADNAADLIVNEAICTVNIKDKSAEITFTPNNYVVSENDQSVKVTVTRKGNNGGKNTCTLKSQDGTAQAPADYEAANVPVVFEAGQSSQVVEIKIVDDSAQESKENFTLSLTCEKPDCVKVNQATVEITDDDVDGKWSPWGPYGDCDKKCGGGSQSRSRTCTNPAPQGEGKQCAGDAQSTQACNTHYCPIDGVYGSYSSYGDCSKSCGTGVQYKTRQCSNPKPQYGGKNCVGPAKASQACNTHPCPIDGVYGGYTPYGDCSKSCGTGVQYKTRQCSNPPNHNMEAKNVSDQQKQVKHVTLIHVQLMESMVAIVHTETVVNRVAPVSNTRPDSAATPNHNMEAKNVSDQQKQVKRVALIHVQLMESMVAILHMETVVSRVAPVSNTRPDSAATPNHNMEAKNVSDQQKQVKRVALIHVQLMEWMVAMVAILHMETVVSRVAPVSNTRPDSAATPNHNMEAKNVSDQQKQVKHVTLIHVQLMESMVAILHMETVVSRVAPVSNTRPDSAATPNHNMEAKNVSDQQKQVKHVCTLIHVQLMESMVAIVHTETVVNRVAPVSNTRPDSAATPNHNMEAKNVSDQQKQVKRVALIHVQLMESMVAILHMETVVSRVAPVSNTRPDSAATPNHNMEAKNVSDQQKQVKHVTLIHVQLMESMVAILHMETVVSRVAPVSNTRPDSAATPNHNMEAKNVSDQQKQVKHVTLIHVQLMESMVAIVHTETVVNRVAPVSNTRPDSAATPNHNMEAKNVSDQQKQVKHVTPITVQVVDGNWSEWGPWSKGSRSCGGATQYRTRTCTNPAPKYGGKDCVGKDRETRACNKQPCPAKFGLKPVKQVVPESVGKVKVIVFRVGNSIGSNRVSVSTVPKSAKSPSDFVNIPETEIIFGPGKVFQAVWITINDDKVPEDDEEFELILKSNDPGVVEVKPNNAMIKILDNDVRLGIEPTKKTVRESDGTVSLTIFRRGNTRGETTATINTCDQSAVAPKDYVALKNFVVKFAPKQTKITFKIKINDDKDCEKIEDFCVTVTSSDQDVAKIEPKKAVVSIVDNDVKLRLVPKAIKVLEGKGHVNLKVIRCGNTKGHTKAVINTEDNTAKAGSDYKPRKNYVVSFGPGETFKHFKVYIKDDNIPEQLENFRVKLSSPDKDITIVKPDISTVHVIDDDVKIGFEKPAKYYFDETAGTVKVALVRNGAINAEHTVLVRSADGTAKAPGDYAKVHKKITFKKNQARVEFTITINNDNKEEGRETFKLKLSTSDGRVQLDPSVATVCIKDDDVNGKWGPWSSWSACGKSCGLSTKSRTRTCDNPAPQGEGKPCTGKAKETIDCYITKYCPINGKWGTWSKWSACSMTCLSSMNAYGTRSRFRKCDSPAPSCGGAACAGGYVAAFEKKKCISYAPCSNAYEVAPMVYGNPYGNPPPTTKPPSPYGDPAPTTNPPNPYEQQNPYQQPAYDDNE